ncbi:MAG: dTDP-glucose 4,6-dehydratase [Hydrogenophilales bacterium 28-61-23]|nr:MAG: dTDP-glucose 4,6-dehydratase [Hydrogenophilales bacterium 28-61-23]
MPGRQLSSSFQWLAVAIRQHWGLCKCHSALAGKDITIYGDGTQTRSFCYVDDMIDGFIAMMATEKGFTGPINMGNPGEYQIGELAEIIVSMCGTSSKVIYQPLPEDDPCQRCPDISLAKQKLDWEPKVQLKDGLERTIAYFRNLAD